MSETQTASLTDFLLARIAEDEAVARAAVESARSPRWSYKSGDTWHLDGVEHDVVRRAEDDLSEVAFTFEPEAAHIARHDPARVLAECAAKRRIVELHVNMNAAYSPEIAVCAVCHDRLSHDAARWPCDTLRALASVYADHPDYRAEWAL